MKMHDLFQHEVLINDLITDGKIKDVAELSDGANAAINDFNDEADRVAAPFLKDGVLDADTEFDDAVIAKLERMSDLATNEIYASVGDDYVSGAQQKADADAAAQQKAQADAALAQQKAEADAAAAAVAAQQKAEADAAAATALAAQQKAEADAAAAAAAQKAAIDAASKRRADAAAAAALFAKQKADIDAANAAKQKADADAAAAANPPAPEKKEKVFFGWFGG